MKLTLGVATLVAGSLSYNAQPASTYDAVVAGMKCTQSTIAKAAQMDCEYNVGMSLRLALPGIGDDAVAFTVLKSDFDGDFYVSIAAGKVHDCAIVKPGMKSPPTLSDFAFISPRSGRVFHTWQQCAQG